MLNEIKTFTGGTIRHRTGVCVGATCIWLMQISKNKLQLANQLKLKDCDDLQKKSLDDSYNWLEDLLPDLKKGIYKNSTIEEGQECTDNSTMSAIIMSCIPSINRFWVIISKNSEDNANAHMMAIFKDDTSYYYINPDTGIYNGTVKEIVDDIFKQNKKDGRESFIVFNGQLA